MGRVMRASATFRISSLSILLIFLLTVALPEIIEAEVASVSLQDMYSRASFVDVVHEDSVSQSSGYFDFFSNRYPEFPLFWRKTAHANVKEIWKGSRHKQISYRASPSWACDVSTAVTGAVAVVFLDSAYVYGLEIAWAGCDRYPLLKDGPTVSISIGDAILPHELASKVMVRPRDDNSSERYLTLNDLKVWCLAQPK
jgi:hypothetical protein